jgi:hypothetical protein
MHEPHRDDPRGYITALMQDLGQDLLVPSFEEAPASVWVTEDRSPTGYAGYFERQHQPLWHRVVLDGRTAVVLFRLSKASYRLSTSKEQSATANLYLVAKALWMSRWLAEHGLMATWTDALAPWLQATGEPWWIVLGVSPHAGRDEIEWAYRQKARTAHPDTGGSHEAFLRLQGARDDGIAAAGTRTGTGGG